LNLSDSLGINFLGDSLDIFGGSLKSNSSTSDLFSDGNLLGLWGSLKLFSKGSNLFSNLKLSLQCSSFLGALCLGNLSLDRSNFSLDGSGSFSTNFKCYLFNFKSNLGKSCLGFLESGLNGFLLSWSSFEKLFSEYSNCLDSSKLSSKGSLSFWISSYSEFLLDFQLFFGLNSKSHFVEFSSCSS